MKYFSMFSGIGGFEYGITGKEGFKLAIVALFSKVIEEIIGEMDDDRFYEEADGFNNGYEFQVGKFQRYARAKLKDILNSRKDKKV